MTGVVVMVDDAAVKAALAGLQARVSDLTPAMEDIGQILLTATDLGFKTESDPWGKGWKELSKTTQAMRRKGKGNKSNKILRDTGDLANSLNNQQALTITKNSVTYGTNKEYAPTHQFGAKMGEYGRYSQTFRRTKYAPGDFRRNAGTVKGFPIPWGDIERRAFLPMDKAGNVDLPAPMLADILDTIARHLLRSTR